MRFVLKVSNHVVLALALITAAASAAPIVVPNVPWDGPASAFNAVLGVAGTVTGSASGTALVIFPVNVPTQTHPLTLTSNPNVATTPTGSSTLGFDDVDLEDRSLESTTIDVTNGATIPFTLGQVVFTGTLAGSPLTVTANISGVLQEVAFTQAAGPSPATPGYDLPGVVSARVIATIDAVATSGFITLPFQEQIDTTASAEASLPGSFDLTDLAPGAPYPHDVLAELSGATDLLFEINDQGDFAFNQDGVDISGSFILDLDVTLSDIDYILDATIPGVVYPAGDANHDGVVSGADYTIWADNFGAGPGATVFQGDFNNDGFVTGADFTIWADNFGVGAAPVAVPEPASWWLACGGGAMVALRWGRRRQ